MGLFHKGEEDNNKLEVPDELPKEKLGEKLANLASKPARFREKEVACLYGPAPFMERPAVINPDGTITPNEDGTSSGMFRVGNEDGESPAEQSENPNED